MTMRLAALLFSVLVFGACNASTKTVGGAEASSESVPASEKVEAAAQLYPNIHDIKAPISAPQALQSELGLFFEICGTAMNSTFETAQNQLMNPSWEMIIHERDQSINPNTHVEFIRSQGAHENTAPQTIGFAVIDHDDGLEQNCYIKSAALFETDFDVLADVPDFARAYSPKPDDVFSRWIVASDNVSIEMMTDKRVDDTVWVTMRKTTQKVEL